ncbi:hypothetical protein GKR53_03900 [Klebsiella sp. HSTU-Sny5]|nr:hypothetical protein L425_01405 [Klebsiella quasipneumoniae subsp. quasipneumoniae]MCJ1873163.1 hypothetical protein [Klebsiella sp. HSTU-Sny5]HCI5985298.1 helix-turn-helix domain-containing protein [Klebsiella quasipneumoniae subsp. quasipneumoniae]HCI6022197.1 helix-turn-helix domain-containing protein [Klebsiella quasipneumoniae subsp. quasipneumoniae]
MNGLTKAIKSAGTATKLANMLGIKPMSVSRWKNRYQGVVPADRVLPIFTATGIVITKDGPQVKKLHQTERMWVVGKNEFYHKETGRRHFAENTRRRLLLDTIKPVGVKHV